MTVTNEVTNEIKALSEFLEVAVNEVKQGDYDCQLYYDNSEYLVLTDEEAQEQASQKVKESLWSMDTDFIMSHVRVFRALEETDYASYIRVRDDLSKMQDNDKIYEQVNEFVETAVDNLDEFVNDAIEKYGRGYFIADNDGIESEHNGFYIYCVD
jgi:hypothetical protein